MPIKDYQRLLSTHHGHTHTIYTKGTGPDIVILPEAPGLHEKVFALGDKLVLAGFTVHLLSLFGEDGKPFRYRDVPRCLIRACIRKEFAMFAAQRSSPLTDWVRSYCHNLYQQHQKGIGLIGMCLTGNFALSMLAEPWMLAPVLCQPSLPILPQSGLHVEPHILEQAKQNPDLSILGLRFSMDMLCPKERFQKLQETFPSQIRLIEVDSSLGNKHNIRPIAHSVLTKDFVDAEGHPTHSALQETISFFSSRLHPS